ncbi:lysylphosphatidylglycerol synthase transmembrane domain-containing protein [Azospirillum sp. TSO35-2]|uniref:lysylphosphatidylglycerol synthase transmembrane domain-containing protein n=1 Tax=Azospirillum sp. TSO35-2 TaxID=716796 RepID=UPI001FFF47B8|nr:lysylphosphatidylglycerol synthase transmembrane domain-containing protein [Azospirillum sp. TSO35-2]
MSQALLDAAFARPGPGKSDPGKGDPGKTAGRRWPVLVKLAVTVVILGALAAGADWAGIAARLSAADPWLFAAGFAAKALTLPLASQRWRAVGRAAGFTLSRWTAFRLQMASSFLGQILPGSVGADLLRGWFTWRLGHAAGPVMLALLVDRLMALLGVVLIGLIGLPHLAAVAPPAVAATVLGGAVVLGVAMVLLLLAGRIPRERLPIPKRLRDGALGRAAWGAVAQLRAMTGNRAAWAALGHSVGVHLATITATILFARSVGLPLGWLDGLAIVPAAIVAAALPVSLGGWGVREGAMVAGFALLGFDADAALLVSLLIGLSIATLSLPGGLFWLLLRSETASPPETSRPDAFPTDPSR